MSQIDEYYKKDIEYRASMIATQEATIKAWGEQIKEVPKEVFEGIELPEEITLKSFMPSLYENPINWEAYDKEYDAFSALVEKIDAIVVKYNEEAIQCLSKHQQLISGKA